jgi:hypothetical protein
MSPLTLRRWHGYVGLFAAPSVLFFSLTGAVQLFSWHEAHGTYQPPVVLERLSSLHKDQVLERHEDAAKGEDEKKGGESEKRADADAPHEEDSVPLAALALKIFFFVIAIGVSFSTGFGVWMGLSQTPRKGLSLFLLVTGTLLPIILIAL